MKTTRTRANRFFSFAAVLLLSPGAIRAEKADNPEAKPVLERNQIINPGGATQIRA
jgi:hypothetical protein